MINFDKLNWKTWASVSLYECEMGIHRVYIRLAWAGVSLYGCEMGIHHIYIRLTWAGVNLYGCEMGIHRVYRLTWAGVSLYGCEMGIHHVGRLSLGVVHTICFPLLMVLTLYDHYWKKMKNLNQQFTSYFNNFNKRKAYNQWRGNTYLIKACHNDKFFHLLYNISKLENVPVSHRCPFSSHGLTGEVSLHVLNMYQVYFSRYGPKRKL